MSAYFNKETKNGIVFECIIYKYQKNKNIVSYDADYIFAKQVETFIISRGMQ